MKFYLDLIEIRPRQAQYKQNELVLGGACMVVDVPDDGNLWEWDERADDDEEIPVLTLEGMVWIRNKADALLNEEIVEIEEKIDLDDPGWGAQQKEE